MSIKSVASFSARCPQCGGAEFIDADEIEAANARYECVGCGSISTVDALGLSGSEVDKAAGAAADEIEDALEKALSKMKW
ncbi:hypothetical protein C4Q26_03250 [Pseudomonas sp. SWI44]|nr:hypothetical protein C4Q26_03250 [Pseudomonas sp. SWI44]